VLEWLLPERTRRRQRSGLGEIPVASDADGVVEIFPAREALRIPRTEDTRMIDRFAGFLRATNHKAAKQREDKAGETAKSAVRGHAWRLAEAVTWTQSRRARGCPVPARGASGCRCRSQCD